MYEMLDDGRTSLFPSALSQRRSFNSGGVLN